MASQWEVIRFILSFTKQPVNCIYDLDAFVVTEGKTVKSEYMRKFIAASHYSVLKCRIRHFRLVYLKNIPKSKFVDNLLITTYTAYFTQIEYSETKKVLTAEAMRTLLF